MPSTVELILFFSYFLILGFILHLEERARERRKADVESSTIHSSPVIYWFRDYWSNRRRLGRNKQSEGLGWKNSDEFDVDSLGLGEVVVRERDNGRCDVQGLEDTLTDLINPYELIRQFEPHSIAVRDISGSSVFQSPGGWEKYVDTSHQLSAKVGHVEPEAVYAEPLV